MSGGLPEARIDLTPPGGWLPPEVAELPLPQLVPVAQPAPGPARIDPRAEACSRLGAVLAERSWTGARVAVALGSRGLGAYRELVAGAMEALHDAGARPFLVPAMGSHGGGTPAGQLRVLRDYGLLDLGAEADADDATRIVGALPDGTPLHASETALAADGLVLLNRVKSHTGFRGPIESGLSKMLVIGLGKRPGAAALHAPGYDGFAARLEAARGPLLNAYPPIVGLAVVEDAQGRPARVEAMSGEEIGACEPELLKDAKARMPRLPFAELDLLVVERAGKDVSGLGMDPNVTGRHPSGERAPPDPTRIALLALSEASEGNANGMGHADVVTRAFAEAIDPVATWTNAITSTSLASVRLPVVMPDAVTCVRLALATCGAPPERARIAWIRDTGHLERLLASPSALAQAERDGALLTVLGPARTPPGLEG